MMINTNEHLCIVMGFLTSETCKTLGKGHSKIFAVRHYLKESDNDRKIVYMLIYIVQLRARRRLSIF